MSTGDQVRESNERERADNLKKYSALLARDDSPHAGDFQDMRSVMKALGIVRLKNGKH